MKRELCLLSLVLSLCVGCSTQRNAAQDVDEAHLLAEPTEVVEVKPTEVVTEIPTVASTLEPMYELNISDIPAYSGTAYVAFNNNIPSFADDELTTDPFEYYSPLDGLGRCGQAYANVCKEIMPTEERGKIGMVKPTGWHTAKYDFVDGQYLYNRCHLIGYQLSAENANERNLITGTRYLNVQGMLPFENMIADYVKEMGNHVLYKVTPIFIGDNLLALGVQMEAFSVEDRGAGVCFNVFCYNVQPGVGIDYATGDNWAVGGIGAAVESEQGANNSEVAGTTYILNTNTKKFHYPTCSSVKQMKDKNKREFTGSRADAVSQGYSPCKICNP